MGSGLLSSVAPYVQSSFEASLIPAIDSLRSLAIVWIPGGMQVGAGFKQMRGEAVTTMPHSA